MKKLALTLAFLAISAFANESEKSQEKKTNDGIAVGIRGGIHIMSMGALDWSFGWHAGAVRDAKELVDLEIFGKVYLQPGVLFFTKNNLWNQQTYWLEVPVLASWKYKLFGSNYRVNIGPYINFGLLGDFEDKLESEFSNESVGMNRVDAGLSIGTGRELGIFWIGANVNMGFIDVSDYYEYTAWHYRFTIGFNFN